MIEWYDVKYFFKSIFMARTYRFIWQRIVRGWDDSDTWSLDDTIAHFALPRVKRFKEVNDGYPNDAGTPERWDEILDEIIWALDYIANDGEEKFFEKHKDENTRYDEWKKLEKRCDDGMKLFGEYFRGLWW